MRMQREESYLIRKGLAILIIILFIGMVFTPSTVSKVEQSSISTLGVEILYVGGNGPGNYSSIQDAIDNASDGDIVFVYDDSSPYYENVNVDKRINLIGENRETTIIDGGLWDDVIYITADYTYVTGFKLQNSRDSSAIKVSSNNNTIFWNIITDTNFGISLLSSSHNIIAQNIFTNNAFSGINLGGKYHKIISNTFLENYYGIYSWNSESNNISENTFINQINNAILLSETSNITIWENRIYTSKESGIELQHLEKRNLISRNILGNNGFAGFYLWNASNQDICYNNISGNYLGIFLIDSSDNNMICHNNIIDNSLNGFFINCSKNRWRRNFWDRPRLLPYPIFGKIDMNYWFNLDWRPAFIPNDIGGIV